MTHELASNLRIMEIRIWNHGLAVCTRTHANTTDEYGCSISQLTYRICNKGVSFKLRSQDHYLSFGSVISCTAFTIMKVLSRLVKSDSLAFTATIGVFQLLCMSVTST